MFGKRKKSSQEQNPVQGTRKRGKGRPTRSRKEAEAANRRDAIPADRKEAKRRARERRDRMWRREQEALNTGEERYLPARDKGRVRRFTRDWVDARYSISEWVLPLMILFILTMLAMALIVRYVSAYTAQLITTTISVGTYGMFLAAIIESIWVNLKIKKQVRERMPSEGWPRGQWFYTFSRMVMARRWRKPVPMVERGEYPN